MDQERVVLVQFPTLDKEYAFRTTRDDLQSGDCVVVEDHRGLSLAFVTRYAEALATQWVVDRVNLAAHRARQTSQARYQAVVAERIARRIRQRLSRLPDRLLAESAAGRDPELAENLAAFRRALAETADPAADAATSDLPEMPF